MLPACIVIDMIDFTFMVGSRPVTNCTLLLCQTCSLSTTSSATLFKLQVFLVQQTIYKLYHQESEGRTALHV